VSEQPRAGFGPADLFETPDLIEPVLGFRSWRVIDGRLRSLYLPVVWDRPVLRAECPSLPGSELAGAVPGGAPRSASAEAAALGQPHMAPDPGCSCGIYAYFEPDLEFSKLDHRGVIGIVTLTGNVEVHVDGMRGEEARVHALAVYERWTRRQKDGVESIAARLGIDLVDLERVGQAAEAYGRPLSPELLPGDLPPEPPRLAWPAPELQTRPA
jgi:hypothetical protein